MKTRKTSYTCRWRQCSGLQLAERLHREGLLLVETFCKWWTTALPSMTGTWCFPSFYRWKIKLLYLFLRLLFQISPRNHNCNVLNVFFIILTHNNARSENGQSILWPFSQPRPLAFNIRNLNKWVFIQLLCREKQIYYNVLWHTSLTNYWAKYKKKFQEHYEKMTDIRDEFVDENLLEVTTIFIKLKSDNRGTRFTQ